MIRCDWPLVGFPLSIGDCNHLTNGNVLLQMHLVGKGLRGSDTASVLLIRKTDSAESVRPSKLSLKILSNSNCTERMVKRNWVMGVFPIL